MAYFTMAFFDPQEAPLAGGNSFFCIRKGDLRIKPAGSFVISCTDGFYADARKDTFLVKKKLSSNFLFIFNDEGEGVVKGIFRDALKNVSIIKSLHAKKCENNLILHRAIINVGNLSRLKLLSYCSLISL
jgi:hypothetical protein